VRIGQLHVLALYVLALYVLAPIALYVTFARAIQYYAHRIRSERRVIAKRR
jgi:hypothetical protein